MKSLFRRKKIKKRLFKNKKFEIGVCPSCGKKLYIKGIVKTDNLAKLGYVKISEGLYEKKAWDEEEEREGGGLIGEV